MAVHAFTRESSSRAHTYEEDHKHKEPGDLRPFSCSTGLCIKLERTAPKCTPLHINRATLRGADMWLLLCPGQAEERATCLKCGEPSPQPQALPLGDDSAAQSCHSEAPRCLGGLAQSSSSSLNEGGKKNTTCALTCMHKHV